MEHRTTRSEQPSSGDSPPRPDDPAGGRHPGGDPRRGGDPLADAADGFFDPYANPRAEGHTGAEDPYGAPPPPRGARPSMSAFFVLLDALRRGLPPELRDQFTAFVREALLTLRSLIDWYLERLDRRPRETRVEDIPID